MNQLTCLLEMTTTVRKKGSTKKIELQSRIDDDGVRAGDADIHADYFEVEIAAQDQLPRVEKGNQ